MTINCGSLFKKSQYIDFIEFIFVTIESKHIRYNLIMTHQITSVLSRTIRLETLIPDLLNWLYYPEQILPFSKVKYLSQCRRHR